MVAAMGLPETPQISGYEPDLFDTAYAPSPDTDEPPETVGERDGDAPPPGFFDPWADG